MKKTFILLFISSLFLVGCDKYLDRQPDDALTSDSIWEKSNTTTQYLWNVYSWIYNDAELVSDEFVFDAYCSDETSGTFPNARYVKYLFEEQTPANTFAARNYTAQYAGIREAGVFIENVDRCPELTAELKTMYKAEARALRAYFYFYLMKNYGPVFFNGDSSYGLLDEDVNTVDRTDWQTLVNWVCKELDTAAANLPETRDAQTELGRITKGAALAIKARLLLYNARPLFNGQVYLAQDGTITPSHMYDNIKDRKGNQLFNTEYDATRWEDAAAAAKAVIDLNLYSLVNSSAKTDDFERGLENLTDLFVDDLGNSELIFAFMRGGRTWRRMTFPQWSIDGNEGGWASLCPTQKLVDAFAMASGVYPVKTEYWESDEYALGKNVDVANPDQVDPAANYSESGSVSMKNPLLAHTVPDKAQERPTMNQFVGREARFYRNVAWSGMQWVAGNAPVLSDLEFYQGGRNFKTSANNYPPTGYLALKFNSHSIDPRSSWGNISWPIVRLGGVYLDYIEALNEYDPNHADIRKYWDELRDRAGLPSIFDLYDIAGDKNLQRMYIRRERMIELCYECHRYTDIRTWMIAEDVRTGYTIGCNVKNTNDDVDGNYWQRREIGMMEYGFGEAEKYGARKFTKKSYLEPFPTSEVNKVPALRNSQNLGW